LFVGHYAASLALKKSDQSVSLGLLFLAVQFVDILFFPLVLLGVERFSIVENYTESTHFALEYMPYTHSLVGSLIIAGAVYALFRFFGRGNNGLKKRVALVVALAVLSHWFFDLIVHTPDLPLLSDSSTKVGLGLWNSAAATYILEAILLLAGLVIYLKSTKGTTSVGKYGMIVLVVLMLLINASNIFGPPFGSDVVTMSVSALVMYFAFAGAAFWLDRKRA
jgi:membrane-bound metal-dependent hydrolase YbcI (DUF457 family)